MSETQTWRVWNLSTKVDGAGWRRCWQQTSNAGYEGVARLYAEVYDLREPTLLAIYNGDNALKLVNFEPPSRPDVTVNKQTFAAS